MHFEPFNEIICKINVKTKPQNVIHIYVRVHTRDKQGEGKAMFYDKLEET